jgi:hypothetical protein
VEEGRQVTAWGVYVDHLVVVVDAEEVELAGGFGCMADRSPGGDGCGAGGWGRRA